MYWFYTWICSITCGWLGLISPINPFPINPFPSSFLRSHFLITLITFLFIYFLFSSFLVLSCLNFFYVFYSFFIYYTKAKPPTPHLELQWVGSVGEMEYPVGFFLGLGNCDAWVMRRHKDSKRSGLHFLQEIVTEKLNAWML